MLAPAWAFQESVRSLDESWLDFHYLDTAETQRFFANWIKRGCSVDEIESAISKSLARKRNACLECS